MRGVDPEGLPPTRLLGGHSELDPRLPIPNRTVKRLCADDSADCPRESRSPPGAQKTTPRVNPLGVCFFSTPGGDLLESVKTSPPPLPIERFAFRASPFPAHPRGACFSADSPLAPGRG